MLTIRDSAFMRKLRRWALWRPRLVMATMWLVLLGACTPPSPQLGPIPTLHIPGVTRFTAFDRLVASGVGGIVSGLATYNLPGSSGASARLLINVDGQVYDIGLNGAGLRRLPIQDRCLDDIAAAPNGEWGACGTESGTLLFSLDPQLPMMQHLISSDPALGLAGGSLSWGPNSAYALTVSQSAGATVLEILYLRASQALAKVVGVVTVDGLLAIRASWSPDGRWVALVGSPHGDRGNLYLLSLSQVLPHLPAPGGPTTRSSLSLTQVQSLDSTLLPLSAWGPSAAFITTASSTGSVTVRDIASGKTRKLFAEHAASICQLAWTPDGQDLAFVVCRPGTQIRTASDQVYLYRAPSS